MVAGCHVPEESLLLLAGLGDTDCKHLFDFPGYAYLPPPPPCPGAPSKSSTSILDPVDMRLTLQGISSDSFLLRASSSAPSSVSDSVLVTGNLSLVAHGPAGSDDDQHAMEISTFEVELGSFLPPATAQSSVVLIGPRPVSPSAIILGSLSSNMSGVQLLQPNITDHYICSAGFEAFTAAASEERGRCGPVLTRSAPLCDTDPVKDACPAVAAGLVTPASGLAKTNACVRRENQEFIWMV